MKESQGHHYSFNDLERRETYKVQSSFQTGWMSFSMRDDTYSWTPTSILQKVLGTGGGSAVVDCMSDKGINIQSTSRSITELRCGCGYEPFLMNEKNEVCGSMGAIKDNSASVTVLLRAMSDCN